jgi:hypothetical protein
MSVEGLGSPSEAAVEGRARLMSVHRDDDGGGAGVLGGVRGVIRGGMDGRRRRTRRLSACEYGMWVVRWMAKVDEREERLEGRGAHRSRPVPRLGE